MGKLRIILDTNVIVSALLIANLTPDKVFKKALEIGELIFSNDTFDELVSTLNKKKLVHYINQFDKLSFLSKLKDKSTFFKIDHKLAISRDKKDDKFLELAESAKAKFIITGDKYLLILNTYCDCQILTSSEFLNLNLSKSD